MAQGDILLKVDELKTYFETEQGTVKAVDGVSFQVKRGETLAVVGESGCGKSVTALSIMQLIRPPRGRIVGGNIDFFGADGEKTNITSLNHKHPKMRRIRGNRIAMIFQEPMTSFNPVYTIGQQIIEAIQLHRPMEPKEARALTINLLERVGISSPGERIDQYPHQFSGGMRQRAMIAMALACDPELLIADEPTTALDVTIEAQILRLLKDLQKEYGLSILLITHDLGVVAGMADNVAVMYTGKIVEQAATDDLFYNPKHPYTQGLLKSIPQIGRKQRLTPIKGTVPNLITLPDDVCYFAPRCPHVMDICKNKEPDFIKVGSGPNHAVKCWLYEESGEVIA